MNHFMSDPMLIELSAHVARLEERIQNLRQENARLRSAAVHAVPGDGFGSEPSGPADVVAAEVRRSA
jgi:hypothetical protein